MFKMEKVREWVGLEWKGGEVCRFAMRRRYEE